MAGNSTAAQPRRVKIDISRPVHTWLAAYAAELSADKDRRVTLTEAIESALERAGVPRPDGG